ncbi:MULTISPECIES: SDR family NAD(P)-dependent oxidoreductase [Sorangium]|uniref:3-oxoacyl-[acyl-carrier-protein] reductase n=1 Tax=Sorangium cellulosum (strain So ce56) TaxID=448385 RepID=A9FQI5_SORC5|nr:SDR family NAD(P)-dependent oxidoreductase [Sorangium cellulosum]CAN92160.1 putative 3-oxoacyl-[acyl-carrier-protein] reductase [Sorangium cellulosum So ce56]
MSLEGRIALVTGGGRGIGRAIAERLAQAGARVAVAGRTQAEIEETAAAVGGVAVRLDVGDREGAPPAIAALEAQLGRIDVLVNNAGVAESAPFDRTSDALWDRMLAVNVTGAFALCRALIPKMIARGFGRVVNVASTAGLVGCAYSTAYCASKHAMVGMTRAIALEIARTPVTINCVCPGWVNTRMADEAISRIAEKTGRGEDAARRSLESMSPQGRMVEPAEVALVVAMLCSDEARSIHGQAIPVDGGQVMR